MDDYQEIYKKQFMTDEEEILSVDVKLTEEDFLKLRQFQGFKQKKNYKKILGIYVLIIIFSSLFLISFGEGDYEVCYAYVIILVIAIIFYVAFLPNLLRHTTQKRISNLSKNEKKSDGPAYELLFYEREFMQISQESVIKIKYENIGRICATKDAIYIYQGMVNVIIIPFRCLEEQKEKLLSLLKSKTSLAVCDKPQSK